MFFFKKRRFFSPLGITFYFKATRRFDQMFKFKLNNNFVVGCFCFSTDSQRKGSNTLHIGSKIFFVDDNMVFYADASACFLYWDESIFLLFLFQT